MNVLLGVANPYHENSYAWVVDVYTDEKVAQDKCTELNKINHENYKKWCLHHENLQPNSGHFETVEPFAWYSKNVLQQLRDIAPNAIPPPPFGEDSHRSYSIQYKVETVTPNKND